MLGPPKLRCLDQPIAVSLEDLIPADNFYRYLDAELDLTFIRDWVRECYAERGRPSIDPVVFFKLQLVLFFEGLRSERKLMETVALNLAHRWYLGYALDEPLPDHSSLTRIRTRLGLPIFQRFFEHVVELCQAAGLVWGKELIFDATKVRANADVDSLMPRWYLEVKAHLAALFTSAAEVETEGHHPPDTAVPPCDVLSCTPAVLPFLGTEVEYGELAAANSETWRVLDRFRLDRDRSTTRGYHRVSDERESTTDPDAAPMRTASGALLGYQDHHVVDGGKARIILAALVTPADVMENKPMLDLLWRVRFRWKVHPERAIGDTTYGTIDNIRALEDAGIRAYLPMRNYEDRTPFYSQARFHYDTERDAYRCPQGQWLQRERVKWTEDVIVYRAEPSICNSCPAKGACTESTSGRIVHRSVYIEYVERVQSYYQTPAYQKARRKREVWVEPLFGEAKDRHGLRRFRLRGLWKVNCEGLLIAAGQNLKRWMAKEGWGRRHGPCGSLALSQVVPLTNPAGIL